MDAPNILMVVFDTARADAFEPYGAAKGSTPVIADLASGGRAVPDAFAACNWTLPSHASMFTGLLPGALGLTSGAQRDPTRGMISRTILEARRERFLPDVLRSAGYATAAISANPWISEVNGFATGFERFSSIKGPARREPGADLRSKIAWALDVMRSTADDGAAEAERLLRDWVGERPGRPFFWFVNLMECHSPYLPPRPYNALGPFDRVRAAREARRFLTIEAMYRYSLGESDIPADALARMRRAYGSAVRLMDAWLGRVLELLDARGVLSDTIVVATSDHGENLGENHLISHILSLDDRLLRVPLVTSGTVEIGSGPVTSLLELPRAIARAAGLRSTPWEDDEPFDGVAVAQASTELLIPVIGELVKGWNVSQEAVRSIARSMTCATDGRYKLIRDASGDHIFDTAADRSETAPLAPGSSPDGAQRLSRVVDRALAERPPAVPDEAASARAPAMAADEAAELEERMRRLGYM
jgi:arylsulfatase A-like enzyme